MKTQSGRGVIGDWLHQQWTAWDKETGEHTSGVQLAEYLDIERHVLNAYLNGKRVPSGENLEKIAAKFGPRIYDLAGIVRPDPQLKRIQEMYDQIPAGERDDLLKLIGDFLKDRGFHRAK